MSLNSDRGMAALGEVNETKRFMNNPSVNTVSNHGASRMMAYDQELADCVREREELNGQHQLACLEIERLHAALCHAAVRLSDFEWFWMGTKEELWGPVLDVLADVGDRRSPSKPSEVA